MTHLDPVDLEVVVAVARTGSIGRAAVALGLAQPSASTRLHRLEVRLGTVLFDRSPRGARLTAAGELFLPYAERLLALGAEAAAVVVEASSAPRLRLGVHGAFAPAVVPAVAAVARSAGVGLDVTDAHTPELITLLADNDLDVAVTVPTPLPADVTATRLPADPIVCVVSSDHPLSGTNDLRVSDLADAELALGASGEPQHDLRMMLARAGAASARSGSVGTAATALALAANGAVAIVPASVAAPHVTTGTLTTLTVEDLPKWSVELLAVVRSADDREAVSRAVHALTAQRAVQ